MSFKGDVAQIPLSNILQALTLNGQEGILTLEAGCYQRRLRILPHGIRLLNFTDNPPDALKLILLKEKLLTESQFQNTLSTWIPGSAYAGDFLILRRILTPEIVTSRLLHQLETLILELVVTPDIKYEFNANADATPYELFNPETLGADLVLSTNAVLMEALRRDDELRRIKELIPSTNEMFTIPDKKGFSTNSIDINPSLLKELKLFLNGEHSVARMTALTSLSSFEVHQTLYPLLKKGLIRPLTTDEKKLLAEKLRKSLRLEDAIETLRSVVLAESTDQTSRLKLVGLLEKSKGDAYDLPEQYLQLSNQVATSEPARALGYLQRGLERSPGHLGILERLFDLHRQREDHAAAMHVARSVAVTAQNPESAPQAIALLYKIINFYPQEPVLFHELADIHLHARDPDSAVSCLKTAADIYDKAGDNENLRKIYEILTRLRPQESKQFKRLPKAASCAHISIRRIFRAASVLLLASVLLSFITLAIVSEYRSRIAFAQIITDLDTHKKTGDLLAARQLLKDFERTYPYSTRIKSLHLELSEVNKLFKTRQDKERTDSQNRKLTSDTNYTRAKMALDSNDYLKASDLINQIDPSMLDSERANDANNIADKINSYFERSKSLLIRADAAEADQDFERSHALRKELLLRYPYSRAAVGLLFPVRLQTTPSNAEVTVDGQRVGQTPILLRLPPKQLPSLRLSRHGYKDYDLTEHSLQDSTISILESHVIPITLSKTTEWIYQGKGSIEGFPAILFDSVYFGTRNGTIYAVKQDTGALLWSYSIPDRMDFAGGVCTWKNLLYFGCFDGCIYVLDASTGRLHNRPAPLTPEQLPIKIAPSIPSEDGIVAVNCDKRVIATYNLATGRPAWSVHCPGGFFLGQPEASSGRIYVITSQGSLLELEHESGRQLRKIQIGHDIVCQGKLIGAQYFFTTQRGQLLSMDINKQVISWSYDCGEQVSSSPLVDGDWVVAISASGKIHCLSSTGELKWVTSSAESFAPDTGGVLFRNHLLLGGESGLIQCFDLGSGGLRWSYKTTGKPEKAYRRFLAPGAISEDRFYIGSEDNTLYCLTLD